MEKIIADAAATRIPPTKVLVAEDFEPYRILILSLIATVPNLQVICEVGDGLLAVEKTQELKPDLVLMDIGLPNLNGIDSARQIRKFAPETNIVFVSQETSPEIVQEALGVDRSCYVVKSRVGIDLLAAVQAVLQNTQFVSEGLEKQHREVKDKIDPPR